MAAEAAQKLFDVSDAIAGVSLLVSIYAAIVAKAGQSRAVRREEFLPNRQRLENAIAALDRVTVDLERLVDRTVPAEALRAGFDAQYKSVDDAIFEAQSALSQTQEAGLFGDGWSDIIDGFVEAWRAEFDCVTSDVRTATERADAGMRAVAAVRAMVTAMKGRVRQQVHSHAR